MPHTGDPAFRCRSCGHLEGPGAAGENSVPHACPACGAGVVLNPKAKALADELGKPDLPAARRLAIAAELARLSRGSEEDKHLDPDNWEVLADQPADRLRALGIDPGRVAKCARHGQEPQRGPVRGMRASVQAQDRP